MYTISNNKTYKSKNNSYFDKRMVKKIGSNLKIIKEKFNLLQFSFETEAERVVMKMRFGERNR